MIEQYYTKLHLLFITFNILQLHDCFRRIRFSAHHTTLNQRIYQ